VVMAWNNSDDDDDDGNDRHAKNSNKSHNKIQLQHMQILQNSNNSRNGPFRIIQIPNPSSKSLQRIYKTYPDFCASYVNYYICNNRTVLVPQFNLSPYDDNAIQIFKETFPNTYTICPIPIHTGIACGGGGIHCVTLQQPAVSSNLFV
jgi:agmatine deiminase